jgi:hypothetical protein
MAVGCRKDGENLNRKLAQKTAILACVLTIAFAYEPQAQNQTSTASLSTASSAQAKPKTKPDAAGAEAGTSEGTEALQKATQNPVASLISVPVQNNNNNFGINPVTAIRMIPIGISKDWNLLVRWIGPIVYQPIPNQPSAPETGVSALETWCLHFSFHQRSPGS